MSEQNVDLTRRFIEAFNARDIDGQVAYGDPSIELHSTFAAVGGAIYHGHDGMRSWHRDLVAIWGDVLRAEAEAYFDLGEHTLTFYLLHGRGQHSGVEVAMPVAGVFRWNERLVVYFKGYVNREDALRDLGVSEDELEPIAP
jgi:SnoaL-like domain